jgi:hypothetical protein
MSPHFLITASILLGMELLRLLTYSLLDVLSPHLEDGLFQPRKEEMSSVVRLFLISLEIC